jgi:hypothetical protein
VAVEFRAFARRECAQAECDRITLVLEKSVEVRGRERSNANTGHRDSGSRSYFGVVTAQPGLR